MGAQTPHLIATHRRAISLSINFAWTLVGNAVYSCGQWLTVLLLAKLTRPELVGQYALGLAIVLPIIMFTNLQLRWVVTTDLHGQRHFGDYLSFRLLSTVLALLIIFGTAWLLGYRGQLRTIIVLVGVAQAIEAISDVYYARLQQQQRMNRISMSMMTRTALSTLGLATTVYFTRSLLWGIVAVALARMVVLLGYDIRGRTHDFAGAPEGFFENEALKPRWAFRVQRELAVTSFPLGLIAVLIALNSSIPRYFIERSLGERALGIFSALAFLYAAGGTAIVSLGQSAFTSLAKSYAEQDLAGFWLLLGKLLAMGAALGIGGIVVSMAAGHELLAIFFRPEYAEHADLLPWIMGAACINYLAQFLGFGMTAAGYYKPQVYLFILTNLAVGLGSFWCIPYLGLFGAIFAVFLGLIIQLTGSILILLGGMRRQATAARDAGLA